MEKGPRKYGLIISSKKKQTTTQSVKKLSAFAESSSEDEDEGKKIKTGALWRENKKNAQKMESRGQVTKALAEDPSVFEYDSIYDQMQEKKRKSDPRLVTKDKSSKYIGNLKKVAERRKLEQEIIYERKVQRELEREGKQAEDQETFLTSAYRKKLEERRKLEEELKLEAYHEEQDDVTKQTDMSRFHRNLLEDMTSDGTSKKAEKNKRKSSSNEQQFEKFTEMESRKRTVRQDEIEEDDATEDRGASRSDNSLSPEPEPQERGVRADSASASDVDLPGKVPSGFEENIEKGTVKEVDPPKGRVAEEVSLEMSKEEKRKIVSAKRTSEQATSSAKERYLARKKAKLSAPIISTDD